MYWVLRLMVVWETPFLTVKVPEGKHKVSLTYVSSGFKEGAILSVVGFVISLTAAFFFLWEKSMIRIKKQIPQHLRLPLP